MNPRGAKEHEDVRLVRRLIETQLSPTRLRVARVAGALASGGLNVFTRLPEERVSEIERRGFDVDEVQRYLDRLEREELIADAAMLRGAFNDLLDRLDNPKPTEYPTEVEPAA